MKDTKSVEIELKEYILSHNPMGKVYGYYDDCNENEETDLEADDFVPDVNCGDGTDFIGFKGCDGAMWGSCTYEVTVRAYTDEEAIQKGIELEEKADFGDMESLDFSNEWRIDKKTVITN